MLHKMSEIRGWTHTDMMSMPKVLFYRYYGYWYSDRLNEEIYRETKETQEKLRR